jgi:two-component SAPR family response regulator
MVNRGHKSNQDSSGLAVYCLGNFRVFIEEQLVNDWNSLKAQCIFKYLIKHRDRPISKDILMDIFWQDANAEAARRNLHQAIYSLRQTLKRGSGDLQYILFQNESYLLNPELQLWIDFEEFEKAIQSGRQREKLGESAEAITQYSIAEGLYQGDYLEEELYEDWTNEYRIYLRSLYMEISDKLSEYYFLRGDIAPAVTLCHKIIAKDKCYESAHRRLMRCYSLRGQRHLAIRQYQNLKSFLQEELYLSPSEETILLCKQIGLNE